MLARIRKTQNPLQKNTMAQTQRPSYNRENDVSSVLRKMFTAALEIPKEEEIEEQTHVPSARNLGTYFIRAAINENEIQRFKDVTLHPSSKLITKLPRAFSFVFSPCWYPEPFSLDIGRFHLDG